jgi:hypothetical protein
MRVCATETPELCGPHLKVYLDGELLQDKYIVFAADEEAGYAEVYLFAPEPEKGDWDDVISIANFAQNLPRMERRAKLTPGDLFSITKKVYGKVRIEGVKPQE